MHFKPEAMDSGASQVSVRVAGLGTFNVRQGFGSWGALLHTIAQHRDKGEMANALKLFDCEG